ncbi:hypothetical protein BpHYR1_019695, partial [Brachionus plicatilis]
NSKLKGVWWGVDKFKSCCFFKKLEVLILDIISAKGYVVCKIVIKHNRTYQFKYDLIVFNCLAAANFGRPFYGRNSTTSWPASINGIAAFKIVREFAGRLSTVFKKAGHKTERQ